MSDKTSRNTRSSGKISSSVSDSSVKTKVKDIVKKQAANSNNNNRNKSSKGNLNNSSSMATANGSEISTTDNIGDRWRTSLTEKIVLDSLEEETSALTKENASLALIIVEAVVKAVLAATDHQQAEEKKRHENEVAGLKAQIDDLIDQRDELENYGRRNTIVLSGSAIPKTATHEDCYDVVQKMLSEKIGQNLTRGDIDVCHRLPSRKPEDDQIRKPIIVKLVRRETKHTLIKACRMKKPPNFFINESLSKTRSKILYVIRKVKKDFPDKISSYKTEDTNIRVYTPPLQAGGAPIKHTLNTRRQLDDFLQTKLNFSSTKYVEAKDWKI